MSTKYKVTVKHDKGKTTFTVSALGEEMAKQIVMDIEGCPANAIVKVRPAK